MFLVKKKKTNPKPILKPSEIQEHLLAYFVGQGCFIMENPLTYSLRKYTYFEIQ